METLADEPIDFNITRIPYFLRPELPGINKTLKREGEAPIAATWNKEESLGTWSDQMDSYTRQNPGKFGGEGQPPHARFGLGWQAAEVGLKFVFSQTMSNSMDALRLVQKVQRERTPEVRERLYEVISRKYFSEGCTLADHDMLVEAAREAGVYTEGLREWLASGEGTFEIQRKYAEIFYGWGYTSIPVTLVSWEGVDQHIQGSQDLKAYLDVFRRIIDSPLPNKPPAEKIPIWEKLARTACQMGTPNGHDFAVEAHSIFFGELAELMRNQKREEQRKALPSTASAA
uniref:DSBA-like thioredoxin domain-containing protein n=1 Tax=Alexandrium monilatum TaxID=311494 RepID=A0A7S4SH30_9DINO